MMGKIYWVACLAIASACSSNGRAPQDSGENAPTTTNFAQQAGGCSLLDEDFESGSAPAEFSNALVTNGPQTGHFSGQFAATTQTLDLGTVDAGDYDLVFDFYRLDTWDGEAMHVRVNGTTVFNHTFSFNGTSSYTGTANCGNLGFGGHQPDCVYPDITIPFTHPGGNLIIEFQDFLDQPINDESAGYDNISVNRQNCTAVFEDDFEGGAKPEWSNSTTENGGTLTDFLGRWDNATAPVTLSVPAVAAGNYDLTFDFYRIDTWDNELFTVQVNGSTVFSHSFNQSNGSSYTPPPGSFNCPGNIAFGGSTDCTYTISIPISHPGGTLTVVFDQTLDQAASDEAAGIDNVSITSTMSANDTDGDGVDTCSILASASAVGTIPCGSAGGACHNADLTEDPSGGIHLIGRGTRSLYNISGNNFTDASFPNVTIRGAVYDPGTNRFYLFVDNGMRIYDASLNFINQVAIPGTIRTAGIIDGDLWGVDQTGGIMRELDKTSGAVLSTLTITGMSEPERNRGLAQDPTSGTVYLLQGRSNGTVKELGTLDMTTGAYTTIDTVTGLTRPHGLAFGSDGKLYTRFQSNSAADELYVFNSTGGGNCDNCPDDANPGQEDQDGDGLGDACDDDDDGDGVLDLDDPAPLDPNICGDQDSDTCDDCTNGSNDPANDGTDTDSDGQCDAGDTDDDNDGISDGVDPAPLDPNICGDSDSDTCDDCSNGAFNPANDGTDFDSDGICDAGDPDDDNDGVVDGTDPDDNNPSICGDTDGDTCDDCSNGAFNPANDGTDFDSDGFCDAGDPDDDNDGVPDGADPDDNNPSICGDADGDNCDDCSSGTFNPGNDGTDTDTDGLCDAGDPDDDNDGVADGDDSAPLNGNVCRDADSDSCDDCTSGTDAPNNDGTDTDADGQCDAGDNDDDNDGVDDGADNAPLNGNVCRDADGDSCDDCTSGTDAPNNDGTDTDTDGLCDAGDPDDDNDGVADGDDSAPLNGNVCRDADSDSCDDCSSGTDAPNNDGTDTDADGLCDAGDTCINDPNNDADTDGVCGDLDNCPAAANPQQENADGDADGDACDTCPFDANNDADTDGVCGDVDNCPATANAQQQDADNDGLGDACDTCANDPENDSDQDSICGDVDNCPQTANAQQENADNDAFGDACDTCINDPDNDDDNDGVCGDVDNCPAIANTQQQNADGDALGDACDTCANDPNNDADSDAVCGDVDNCPQTANAQQTDTDQDGLGDACDSCVNDPNNDQDQDAICGDVDNCPTVANPNQEDQDGDGTGDACDQDTDGDGCPDATDDNPAVASGDTDGDSLADDCDADDDNDGVPDGDDNSPTDPDLCADTDADGCDDCAVGADGFGTLPDNDPNNDGTDTDNDGVCDLTDTCINDPNNDEDGDTICGDVDNCPSTANTQQENADNDAFGDACDTCPNDADNDADGDSVCGDVDNCPADANTQQVDMDADGMGDVCDACPLDGQNDMDQDGVCGDVDNCPTVANQNQEDLNSDGEGDACDDDADGDNCPNASDDAPLVASGDTDGDTFADDCDTDDDNDGVLDGADSNPTDPNQCQDNDGDSCDDCAVGTDGFGAMPDNDTSNDGTDSDNDGICDAGELCGTDSDSDGDGICDAVDNCKDIVNADQADADEDGIGDICDEDPGTGGSSCQAGSPLPLLLLGLMLVPVMRRRRS